VAVSRAFGGGGIEELVAQATKHFKEVHNQEATREQLLAMATKE
jgi:hypothetical protein